jgi:hypothetical protein
MWESNARRLTEERQAREDALMERLAARQAHPAEEPPRK